MIRTDSAGPAQRRRHKELTRNRRLPSLAVLTVAVALAIGTATRGYYTQDEGAVPNDLRAVLTDEIPEELSLDVFDALGPNWEDWSNETLDLLADLYEERQLDAAGQRGVLNRLRTKLGTIKTALGDPAYRSIHGPLRSLRRRLARRVNNATAALDILEMDDSALEMSSGSTATGLQSALSDADTYLNRFTTGDAWRQYLGLNDLRLAVEAGDAAAAAMCESVARKLNPAATADDATHAAAQTDRCPDPASRTPATHCGRATRCKPSIADR